MAYLVGTATVFTVFALFAAAAVVRRAHAPGVVVLLFHRLKSRPDWEALSGPERNFCCPADRFTSHIDWMRAEGFRFIDLDEIHRIVTGEVPPTGRLAAITFDDGSASVHELAAPILAERGIPAAVFVTVDPNAWVHEHDPRMSTEALRTLESQGFTIGAHGVSHHGLNELAPEARDTELRDARAALNHELGHSVVDMAIPLNFYDQAVLDSAKAHGYRMVFTANPGRVDRACNPLELPRIGVEGQTTTEELAHALSPRVLAMRRIIGWLKRVPPRVLGERRWMPIRHRLFHSAIGRYLHFRHLARVLATLTVLWLALLSAGLVWVLGH